MAKETKDSFRNVLAAANGDKRFPVLGLVRNNPEHAAILSKLITPREQSQFGNDGRKTPTTPDIGSLNMLSDRTAQNITDARTVMQILPDMELSAQILVSSILSPKDMMTTELTYSAAEGLLPPDIMAALMSVMKKHFENDYKIKPLLPKMLRDMLFETGSWATAVIPENTVDDVINGDRAITLESLSDHIKLDGNVKPLGLLGPAVKPQPTATRHVPGLSLESLNTNAVERDHIDSTVTFETILPKKVNDSFLSVTDNHTLLKIPQINQKIREQRIVEAIGSRALESLNIPIRAVSKMSDREMTNTIYKNAQYTYKPIAQLKTQEQLNRRTVGSPLVMHIPSEAVIPVHVPGCPEQQVGFFVLIDAEGNPVSKANDPDHYQQLSQRLNGSGSFASAMLGRVKGMMEGFDQLNVRDRIDYSARAYGDMVEQDLLARLRNGVYGTGMSIAKKDEVYRIMLARALAKQHTQLLFIPAELMTYFAFRYNEQGIGQSILDDMKILNSLRAMLMFANVMASLKNSIGRTEVKIKLDESDPNPKKTIETAMHEIIRSRQTQMPLGMNNPTDLVDWLQRSGIEFTFEGHPGLPDVNVDFGEKNSNYTKPDTELEESLRKRAIMATGLSPETVDASFQAEFATSIVTNNILLSKRVMGMQEVFTPQLSDHLRKYTLNSENLINELRTVLENNYSKLNPNDTVEAKKEAHSEIIQPDGSAKVKARASHDKEVTIQQFLNEFIMSFEVSLPRPNSVTLENQMDALETYTKALDTTLDAYLSDKFFTSTTGGKVSEQVNTVKEVLKSYFIRQWLSENGVMTELSNLTNMNAEGKASMDIFEIQKTHIEGLTASLTKFMVKLEPIKNLSDKVIDKLEIPEDNTPTDTPSASGDDGFGFGGGDDAFDVNAPIPEEETTPTDTEETPKEAEEGKEGESPSDDKKNDDEPSLKDLSE